VQPLLVVEVLLVLELLVELAPVLEEEAAVLLELLAGVPVLVDELELAEVTGAPPEPPAPPTSPVLDARVPELVEAEPDAPPEPTRPMPYTAQEAANKGAPRAAKSKAERIGAMVAEASGPVDSRWRARREPGARSSRA
jgi:hypothetical protein